MRIVAVVAVMLVVGFFAMAGAQCLIQNDWAQTAVMVAIVAGLVWLGWKQV